MATSPDGSVRYTQIHNTKLMGEVVAATRDALQAVTVELFPSTTIWVEDALRFARALQGAQTALDRLAAWQAEVMDDAGEEHGDDLP